MTSHPFNWRTAWLCLSIVAVVYGGSLAYRVMVRYDGNITGLFCVGDKEPLPAALADENLYVHRGWIGYDGQFTLFLAYDPLLQTDLVASLPKAAYRYQRIGLPLLAYVMSGGNRSLLPYLLVGLNWGIFLVGCWFVCRILEHFQASAWWVFVYAFSPGLMSSEFRVLPDATATSLVFIAIFFLLRDRWMAAAVLLSVATMVRETVVVIAAALVLWALWNRAPRKALTFLGPIVLYGIWCAVIRVALGQWPFFSALRWQTESNFDWPMVGIVEKFAFVLRAMVEVQRGLGMPGAVIAANVVVEVLFNLGLFFAFYLSIHSVAQRPRHWLSVCLCVYTLLAICLSVYQWNRFWHLARVLDPLILLPWLAYLENRDSKYLVPSVCAAPVSLAIWFA